jgi:hypothetical protein
MILFYHKEEYKQASYTIVYMHAFYQLLVTIVQKRVKYRKRKMEVKDYSRTQGDQASMFASGRGLV